MSYTRVRLQGAYADIISDIQSIERNGIAVYPDFPAGYECRPDCEPYIVSDVSQEIAGYNEYGEAVMEEQFTCYLVLPENFDASNLLTLSND